MNHQCSFCGKGKNEVKKLIVNHNDTVFICDECINKFKRILNLNTHAKVVHIKEIV